MMHLTRNATVVIAIALLASFLFALPTSYVSAATKSSGFVKGVSTSDLQAQYEEVKAGGDKVRILIVPGHEPDYGGAQYGGFYERELVLELSNKLATELRTDANLEVLVARGSTDWNRNLDRYFDRNMKSIKKFVDIHKKAMKKLLKKGKISELEEQAGHNAARSDVALRLYGINKWANENDVDLMLHVHLNDSGGRAANEPGQHTGFAIYVPDKQYGNAGASREVAEAVFAELNTYNATSTLPIEDKGVVEDQQLIALGAYNTAKSASILLEYSYIYEPRNTNEATRSSIYADQAFQTARALQSFFSGNAQGTKVTRALPYTWKSDIAVMSTSTTHVSVGMYALQAALHAEGVYPPKGTSLTNCPVDGVLRGCVTDALIGFQKARGLALSGVLDVPTRNVLNRLYSDVAYTETVSVVPTPILSIATSTQVIVAKPVVADPSTTCTSFSTTLKLNSTDVETKGQVSKLQKILAQDKTIYPEGKITGFFGPATDTAVKAFQIKKALVSPTSSAYGLFGPATAKALSGACR